MKKIYLFEKEKETVQQLTENLLDRYLFEKVFSDEDSLSAALQREKIDILLINVEELTKQINEKISAAVPYLIVFSNKADTEIFRKTLELRANAFLQLPVSSLELLGAIEKAIAYLKEQPMVPKKNKPQQKTITLVSSKGGVGKSVIASNLAWLLSQNLKEKTLIIDTVHRMGAVDILFDINEKRSMQTIPEKIDNEENYFLEIRNSIISKNDKLDVLLAGEKGDGVLTAEKLKNIISILKGHYTYIIVDTDICLTGEVNLMLVDVSDIVLMVSTPDLAALKNLKHGLELIKNYYYSTEKVKVIINRFDKCNELTIEELEKFMKCKIALVIPEARDQILRSVNKGVPFVAENGSSDAALAMQNLEAYVQGKTYETPDKAEKKNTVHENKIVKSLRGMLGGS